MLKLANWLYKVGEVTNHLKIASITMQCDLEPDVNREKMAAIVIDILSTHPDVELILFGETILGWYAVRGSSREYHQRIAETIPGDTSQLMSSLAKENGVYLSFGMTEACDGEIYNSQVLINHLGEIAAVHRKFHLMESASIFKAGKVPATVVEINGIRTGIIVCSDIQSAIVRKALKTGKVELILGGLANPRDPNFFVSGMIAKLFDAWIATANRYGDENGFNYEGDMVIGDPLGRLRHTGVGSEQFLYAELFFMSDESFIKRALRRSYVGLSFIPYLLRNLGVIIRQIKPGF
jgi:predicted amidohydrolase